MKRMYSKLLIGMRKILQYRLGLMLMGACLIAYAYSGMMSTATADAPVPTDDIHFEFSPSTGTITAYKDTGPRDVIIPAFIAGTPVKAIMADAFKDKGLTSVVIPDSVETIGPRAFMQNGLTAVTLPSGLTSIEAETFTYNSLTSVTVPEGIETIGIRAFQYNQLISVILPDSLTSIGSGAFGNNQLAAITFPEGLQSIGSGAFQMNQLTSVTLPDSVSIMEDGAFAGNLLASVTLSKQLTSIEPRVFQYNQLTEVVIPENVIHIGINSFQENQLVSVTLPDTLKSIGAESFIKNRLTSVELPVGLEVIGNSAFEDNELAAVFIPDSVAAMGDSAFKKNHLTSVTIPAGWTEIPYSAFSDNRIASITFPESIEAIRDYAFAQNQLTTIQWSNRLTAIGTAAFSNNALTEVVIPDSVTTVGTSAFYKNRLTSVTFPSASMNFGLSVFSDNQLTAVNLPDWMTAIPSGMFSNNRLTSVTWPAGVQDIGNSAFSGNRLTTVDLPDSLRTIGNTAFTNNRLTSITIPAGVTSLGRGAFGNNALISATFLGNPTTIGLNAFGGNQANSIDFYMIAASGSTAATYAASQGHTFVDLSLFEVDAATGDITRYYDAIGPEKITVPSVMPGGIVVTGIGANVFGGTEKVKSVILPNTVTRLSSTAFVDSSITHLWLSSRLAEIAGGTFANAQLESVVLLNKDTVLQAHAFQHNPPELILYGHPGSGAETYAIDSGIAFQPLALLSQSTDYAFADAAPGYASAAPLSVTVTKRMPGSLGSLETTLSGENADAFELDPPAKLLLDDTTKETAFAVRPKDGLAAGTYSARVTLDADYGLDLSFNVSFKVGVPGTVPGSPGSNAPSVPAASTTPESIDTSVNILVNGKAENAGTATTGKRGDRTVTTIVIDPKKLDDRLSAEGLHAVVTIPVKSTSDIIVGELDGQTVKNMEDKQAVLKIQTDRASYTLPAQQINIDAISDRIGKSVTLQNIKIQIEIAAPTADTVKVAEDAAQKDAFTLIGPAVDFTVQAVYGGTTLEVSKFTAYVERIITIPDGVDPDKITTGVAVEADGTVRHVPTKVTLIDGAYHAVINSLTNSTYALVRHPVEFTDLATHWAKDEVNDMGSRMVIEGTGSGRFSPDRHITRAEFAAIIVRGLGLKLESSGATIFSDVQETAWYSGAIHTAHAYSLFDGYNDGTFRPNDKITREQAMTIIAKAMKLTVLRDKLLAESAEETLRPFEDAAAVASWAKGSVADAVQAGIVSGRNADTLAPQGYMTRAEVAATIQRLLKQSGLI